MTTATDWRTRVGDVWAAEWRRTDRALAGLATQLDAAILDAAPAGPFRALDVGCGAGATSLALAATRTDADVLGADLSPGLIEVANARLSSQGSDAGPARPGSHDRAAGVGHLAFRAGDAIAIAAQAAPFDLLFSRHGVMFFPDPHAAFVALRRAAAPGAKLVFTCFADVEDNPWATLITSSPARSASYVPGPFAFADMEQGHAFLATAGWDGVARRVPFSYRVGEGDDPVADAASFLTRIGPAASALRDASPDARPALEALLRDRLERRRSGHVIDFPATAWLWSATAGAGHPA